MKRLGHIVALALLVGWIAPTRAALVPVSTACVASASGIYTNFAWSWVRQSDQQGVVLLQGVDGISNAAVRLARGGRAYLTVMGGILSNAAPGTYYTFQVSRTNLPPAALYDAEIIGYGSTNTATAPAAVLAMGRVDIAASVFDVTNSAVWTNVLVQLQLAQTSGVPGSGQFPFPTSSLTITGAATSFSWDWVAQSDQRIVAGLPAGVTNCAFRLSLGNRSYLTLAGGLRTGSNYTAYVSRTNLPPPGYAYEAELLGADDTNTAGAAAAVLARGTVRMLASIWAVSNGISTNTIVVQYVLTGGSGGGSGGPTSVIASNGITGSIIGTTLYMGHDGRLASTTDVATVASSVASLDLSGVLQHGNDANGAEMTNIYRLGLQPLGIGGQYYIQRSGNHDLQWWSDARTRSFVFADALPPYIDTVSTSNEITASISGSVLRVGHNGALVSTGALASAVSSAVDAIDLSWVLHYGAGGHVPSDIEIYADDVDLLLAAADHASLMAPQVLLSSDNLMLLGASVTANNSPIQTLATMSTGVVTEQLTLTNASGTTAVAALGTTNITVAGRRVMLAGEASGSGTPSLLIIAPSRFEGSLLGGFAKAFAPGADDISGASGLPDLYRGFFYTSSTSMITNAASGMFWPAVTGSVPVKVRGNQPGGALIISSTNGAAYVAITQAITSANTTYMTNFPCGANTFTDFVFEIRYASTNSANVYRVGVGQ